MIDTVDTVDTNFGWILGAQLTQLTQLTRILVSTVSTVSTVHLRRNGPPLRSQCTNRNYDLAPGSIAGFAKPINKIRILVTPTRVGGLMSQVGSSWPKQTQAPSLHRSSLPMAPPCCFEKIFQSCFPHKADDHEPTFLEKLGDALGVNKFAAHVIMDGTWIGGITDIHRQNGANPLGLWHGLWRGQIQGHGRM